MLRESALGLAAAIGAITSAFGDEAPFVATPPSPGPAVATLPDIMGKIQLRHIKLWQALRSKNWDLLDYELGQTRESFDTTVVLYENIPMDLILGVDKALRALQQDVKTKDAPSLERGFANLTAACNSCHQTAGVGFIVIKTPGLSPFSNQEFSPVQK